VNVHHEAPNVDKNQVHLLDGVVGHVQSSNKNLLGKLKSALAALNSRNTVEKVKQGPAVKETTRKDIKKLLADAEAANKKTKKFIYN